MSRRTAVPTCNTGTAPCTDSRVSPLGGFPCAKRQGILCGCHVQGYDGEELSGDVRALLKELKIASKAGMLALWASTTRHPWAAHSSAMHDARGLPGARATALAAQAAGSGRMSAVASEEQHGASSVFTKASLRRFGWPAVWPCMCVSVICLLIKKIE